MKKCFLLFSILIAAASYGQEFELLRKSGHQNSIGSVSISPDNKYFVSVDNSGLGIVWDISTGQQFRAIKDVLAAAFAKDNQGIYLVMSDKTFKVVDIAGNTIKQLSTLAYQEERNPGKRYFYPESGFFVNGGNVFHTGKGYTGQLSASDGRWGTAQDYSPALGQAVMVSSTGIVSFYNLNTRQAVREFNLNIKYASNTKFSKDGSLLLVNNSDTLRILEVNSGKVVRTIIAPRLSNGSVRMANFSPDGNAVAFSSNSHLSLYDVKSGKKLWEVRHNMHETGYGFFGDADGLLSFTEDGRKMLLSTAGSFILFDATTGSISRKFINEKQINLDNFYLLPGEDGFAIRQNQEHHINWDLKTGAMGKPIPYKFSDGPSVPSANGKTFFGTPYGKEELVIEINEDGKEKHVFPAFESPNRTFRLGTNYDGQYLMKLGFSQVPKCKDGTAEAVEIFHVQTRKSVFKKTCNVTAAKFANSKNILAIKEKWTDKNISFYEIPSGRLLYTIEVPTMSSGHIEMQFSANDRYLNVPSDKNKTVTVIDLQAKKSYNYTSPILDAMSEYNFIYGQGFTPDERYLIYHTSGAQILFFDIASGKFNEQLTIKGFSTKEIIFSKTKPYMFISLRGGIIKVWSLERKQVVATLYPNGNSGDWAVVAPDGRFDANAGAQASMYHVLGTQIMPLSVMFERYYTPRLLPRILEGERFDPVPDINNLKKTPVVTIQYKEGSRNLLVDDDDVQTIQTKVGTATLTVKAECPSDAVSEIRLYQNGKLVQTTRNLVVEDEKSGDKTLTKTFVVELVAGANNFKAIALNSQRTEGKPAVLVANYTADKPTPSNGAIEPAGLQLHLLVVGINNYKNPKYNLNYAKADAEAFKVAMQEGAKTIFTKVNTHYITDEAANKAGLIAAFEKVKAAANPQDLFVFYYAGHGVMNDQKEFYLVPHDVTQLYGNDGALAQKGLSAALIQQFSKDIKAQKQLFILDACQSAAAIEAVVSRGAAEEKAIAQLARSTGTHWLTASGSEQFASEFGQLGHGSFTYCLLEAFKGGGDNGDKKLTVKELDAYLQNKVPEITQKYKGTAQYPASYGYGNDFPILIIK